MQKHERAKNQDYAIAFEIAVATVLNANSIPTTNISLNQQELDDLTEDALNVGHAIKAKFGTDVEYTYCGRHTSNALGDIMTSDGQSIELKYVYGNSSGTYHNTSIEYFHSLGM